jgi:hypothetical protein
MPVQADDIADLVVATQRDLGEMRWTDIATDLQDYVAMTSLLRNERTTFNSGYGIQFNVMHDDSGAASNTGLFAVDNVNVGDVMATGNVPWRHTNTNYAIERREIAMNRNPRRLIELIKIRRADAMISLAALLENNFWDDPADDSLTPFGLPYWVVDNGTTGFNGGNNATFSGGPAGISATTYANWSNWTARYTNITKTDLIRKMREGATKTGFRTPTPIPQYNTGDRYVWYCNYDVMGPFEEVLESQNENLGNDLASKDGQVVFRGNPVRWVPKLDADTKDPVFGINWGVFKIGYLEGEFMREEGPNRASNQHTVFQTHIDLTYQFYCTNRRRLISIQKA